MNFQVAKEFLDKAVLFVADGLSVESVMMSLAFVTLMAMILETILFGDASECWVPIFRVWVFRSLREKAEQAERWRKEAEERVKENYALRRAYNYWSDPAVLEAEIPGSVAEKSTPPPFQFVVSSRPKGHFQAAEVILGQGLCVNLSKVRGQPRFFFLIPLHVVELCSFEFTLTGPLGEAIYTKSMFKTLRGFDVAYREVDHGACQKIGVSVAKPKTLEEGSPAFCCAKGLRFSGYCEDENVLGVVSFTGTTKPGYSGAAYYGSENTAFAMHTTGAGTKDGKNCGISLVFIRALLSAGIPESSEEYYEDVITRQFARNKLVWGYSHPDERDMIVFRDMKGEYHEVESDLFDRIAQRHGMDTRHSYREGGKLEGKVYSTRFRSREVQTTFVDWEDRVQVEVEVKKFVEKEIVPTVYKADEAPKVVEEIPFVASTVLDREVAPTPRVKPRKSGLEKKMKKVVKESEDSSAFLDVFASEDLTTQLPESDAPNVDELINNVLSFQESLTQEALDMDGRMRMLVQQSEASTHRWVEQQLSTLAESFNQNLDSKMRSLEELILQKFSHAPARSATQKPSKQLSEQEIARRQELKRLEEERAELKKQEKEHHERRMRLEQDLRDLKQQRKELGRRMFQTTPKAARPRKNSLGSSSTCSKSSALGE